MPDSSVSSLQTDGLKRFEAMALENLRYESQDMFALALELLFAHCALDEFLGSPKASQIIGVMPAAFNGSFS